MEPSLSFCKCLKLSPFPYDCWSSLSLLGPSRSYFFDRAKCKTSGWLFVQILFPLWGIYPSSYSVVLVRSLDTFWWPSSATLNTSPHWLSQMCPHLLHRKHSQTLCPANSGHASCLHITVSPKNTVHVSKQTATVSFSLAFSGIVSHTQGEINQDIS